MSTLRSTRRLATTVSLSVVMVAGCASGGSSPSAAPTQAPPSATAAASAAVSAAPSAAGPVILPVVEKKTLKWGQSGTITSGALPLAYALGAGMPAKYGIDIEFFEFNGGSQAAQALLAGQVDVSDNSGGPVVASLTTDTPLMILYVTRSNLTDNMYSIRPRSRRPTTSRASRSRSRASARSHTPARCWRSSRSAWRPVTSRSPRSATTRHGSRPCRVAAWRPR